LLARSPPIFFSSSYILLASTSLWRILSSAPTPLWPYLSLAPTFLCQLLFSSPHLSPAPYLFLATAFLQPLPFSGHYLLRDAYGITSMRGTPMRGPREMLEPERVLCPFHLQSSPIEGSGGVPIQVLWVPTRPGTCLF
jgi:hypothetical protein